MCNVAVERHDLVRGHEYAKGEYVEFREAELEPRDRIQQHIDLKEFVPLSRIDPVYFESSHYLGAAEGGEKPYRLLADALIKGAARTKHVQLARFGEYKIPTVKDIPVLKTVIVAGNEGVGPP